MAAVVSPCLNDLKIEYILQGSATKDWASIDDVDMAEQDITVAGAALGDVAFATMTVDQLDLGLTAEVTSANTVTCQCFNNTGGAVNMTSGTLTATVFKIGTNGGPVVRPDLNQLNITEIITATEASSWSGASSDGNEEIELITVTGASIGDIVLVTHADDVEDLVLNAHVSAPDVVTVQHTNFGVGTPNPATNNPLLTVHVLKIGVGQAGIRPYSNDSNIAEMLTNSVTEDWGAITNGNEEIQAVTVTGATLGEVSLCSHSVDVDGAGLTCQVTNTNEVTCQVFAPDVSDDPNVASGTLRAYVLNVGTN